MKKIKKLMTSRDLQDYLKVSESTIFRMLKSGMPVYKFEATNRFNIEEVLDWMRKNNEKEERKGVIRVNI